MSDPSVITNIDLGEPRLRCFMNLQALSDMPLAAASPLRAVRDAGYQGVQFSHPIDRALKNQARGLGLGVCGGGRVNTPADAGALAEEAHDEGLECLTLHVGWGTENDDEAAALIGAILEAAAKHSIPLYPETHRATIFQDPWRTLQFLARFPELEFNGDFSHWYTGTEMVYGGFDNKLAFIRPVLGRIAFLHGRIGNPGCMQVDIGDGSSEQRPFIDHFRALWTESFLGFLRRRPLFDSFCFTPELLGPEFYYARTFGGREETNRWEQSLVLIRVAHECFAEARRRWDCAERPE
jgi:sugar phosphate isomerase/epimerase